MSNYNIKDVGQSETTPKADNITFSDALSQAVKVGVKTLKNKIKDKILGAVTPTGIPKSG